ncbi:MAG: hypothetical protein HRF49_02405 [bacterium]|jgi:hypothetical protein
MRFLRYVVRFVAALWFLSAAFLVLFGFFRSIGFSLLSLLGLGGGFVSGFVGTVGGLWALAGAVFDGIIGWFLWRLDDNYRGSVALISIIIGLFGAFQMNMMGVVLALLTIAVTLPPMFARVYVPGGIGTYVFGLERLFRRRRRGYYRVRW